MFNCLKLPCAKYFKTKPLSQLNFTVIHTYLLNITIGVNNYTVEPLDVEAGCLLTLKFSSDRAIVAVTNSTANKASSDLMLNEKTSKIVSLSNVTFCIKVLVFGVVSRLSYFESQNIQNYTGYLNVVITIFNDDSGYFQQKNYSFYSKKKFYII